MSLPVGKKRLEKHTVTALAVLVEIDGKVREVALTDDDRWSVLGLLCKMHDPVLKVADVALEGVTITEKLVF